MLAYKPSLMKSLFKAFAHFYLLSLYSHGASLQAQLVKTPPAMQETWARSLGWEDPLEKGKGFPL